MCNQCIMSIAMYIPHTCITQLQVQIKLNLKHLNAIVMLFSNTCNFMITVPETSYSRPAPLHVPTSALDFKQPKYMYMKYLASVS